MQKACRHILAVAGRIIFIGVSIQIVLGILWIFRNFLNFQQFGESALYVQISKNFLCDEYTGILYPVILMLTRGVGDILHIPYYLVVYLVQLLFACYAAHRFVQKIHRTGRGMDLWCTFAMLTIPMALQCHLAILPHSLTSSFALLELSFAWEAICGEQQICAVQLVKTAPFWLLCTLLMPEFLYLGAIPIILVLVFSLFQKENRKARQIFYHVAVICAFAGIIVSVGRLTRTDGSLGRAQKSVSASAASRFAWSSLMDYYDEWPQEMKNAVDYGKLMECAFYPDNMARVLEPLAEKTLGVEQAQEFFWQISKTAWTNNRRDILHEMAWDAASYAVSPLTLQLQLKGRGYDSSSGRNYEIMRQNAPVLTRQYVNYSCWWFGVSLVLLVAAALACGICKRKKITKQFLYSCILCVMSAAFLIAWYTLQGAGIMDYKNAILVNLLWMAATLLLAGIGIEDGKHANRNVEKTV